MSNDTEILPKAIRIAIVEGQPANEALAVPDGWQLVPVEPTEAMLDAGCDGTSHWPTYAAVKTTWSAVIAAAPAQKALAAELAAPAQQQAEQVPEDFVCDSKPLERLLNATAMVLETPCQDSATYWAGCLADVELLLAAPAQAEAGLMHELRDLATAIPTLLLAIPKPNSVPERDALIERVNALIERADAALAGGAK